MSKNYENVAHGSLSLLQSRGRFSGKHGVWDSKGGWNWVTLRNWHFGEMGAAGGRGLEKAV